MNIAPTQFYLQQLEQYKEELTLVKRKLNISSSIRLLVFLAIAFCIYLFWDNLRWMVPFLTVGIGLFLFLITRHTKLRYLKNFTQALVDYNSRELRILKRDFHDLPDGTAYNDPTHAYSQDIDLFGRGSFFQYANRTALQSGTDLLASKFLSNNVTEIQEKQEAIKELSALAVWRQQFYAIAKLVKTEASAGQVSDWLENYSSFTPSFSKALSYGFSGITILSFIAYYFQFISGYILFSLFGLGLLITSRFMKKTSDLANLANKTQSTFNQYSKLILSIEGLLDSLDQRNNVLVAIFINGFFLRDILVAHKIEKWIEKHKEEVPVWFDTIAFFDAYNSLGNYAFNHPLYQYPEIISKGNTLNSTQAIHPLLDPTIAVSSDIKIADEQFFIVTGANMAGKSTFLRTVALQIVMGNLGLPLSAQKVAYQPIKLITSMRTTDSLADDESYFFSELKRLKFIVDEIKNDRYFIILDEILKGTNSTDKAIGCYSRFKPY